VNDAPLAVTGSPLAGVAGHAINAANIATFTDGNPGATINDFTATIDWGDGTPPQTFAPGAGVIVSNGSGGFIVNGPAHTYTAPGIFNATVTITDDGGNTATVSDPVTVAAASPTVVPDRTGVNVGHSVTADAAHGVLANDTDPITGDTLHVTAVNGSNAFVDHSITIAGHYGSLTMSDDGSYSYTAFSHDVLPASGVASDVFNYTASTGQGGTADSTLTVIVMAPEFNYFGPAPGSKTVTGPMPGGHAPVLDGGAGGLNVVATAGKTVLIGGPGDTLTGGKGVDTFEFTGHFGNNIITNYNPSNDVIALDHTEFASLGAITATQPTGTHNTVIAPAGDTADTITLIGINPSQLHVDASHFLLV
jgi:VCBS repeat-containing protein